MYYFGLTISIFSDHFMSTPNSSYTFGESILARTLLQKEPDGKY